MGFCYGCAGYVRVNIQLVLIKIPKNLNSFLFQEKLEAWLASIKIAIDKKAQKTNVSLNTENLMKIFTLGTDLTKPFEYLLATGNLRSKTGEIK